MNLPFSHALVNFDSSQIGPYFEGSMLVYSLHQKIAVVHFGESDVRSHNSLKDLVLLLRTFFFLSHIFHFRLLSGFDPGVKPTLKFQNAI